MQPDGAGRMVVPMVPFLRLLAVAEELGKPLDQLTSNDVEMWHGGFADQEIPSEQFAEEVKLYKKSGDSYVQLLLALQDRDARRASIKKK